MKHNVDLTQNRVFSGRGVLPEAVIANVKKPSGMFLCGSASEREESRRYHEYDNPDKCHRCGAEIHKIPWRYELSLCSKCDEELKAACASRYMWKYHVKEPMTNFLVTQMNKR